MKRSFKRILSAAITERDSAYAVLDRDELLYYSVRANDKSASPYERLRDLRKNLLSIRRHLRPQRLIVISERAKSGATLSFVPIALAEMLVLSSRLRLTVSWRRRKRVVCGRSGAHATRSRHWIRRTLAAYPELTTATVNHRRLKPAELLLLCIAVAAARTASSDKRP